MWKRQQPQITSGTIHRRGQGSEGEAVTAKEDDGSTGDGTQQEQGQLCSRATVIYLDAETWYQGTAPHLQSHCHLYQWHHPRMCAVILRTTTQMQIYQKEGGETPTGNKETEEWQEKRNDRERTVMSDKKNIKVIEIYFKLTKANKRKKPVKF